MELCVNSSTDGRVKVTQPLLRNVGGDVIVLQKTVTQPLLRNVVVILQDT